MLRLSSVQRLMSRTSTLKRPQSRPEVIDRKYWGCLHRQSRAKSYVKGADEVNCPPSFTFLQTCITEFSDVPFSPHCLGRQFQTILKALCQDMGTMKRTLSLENLYIQLPGRHIDIRLVWSHVTKVNV